MTCPTCQAVRAAQGGDDVADLGLIEAENRADDAAAGPIAPGAVQPEELAFGVHGRLGRVEVLRLGLDDRPAAERDDPSGQAEDREDDPAAKTVAIFAGPRARQDEAALLEQRDRHVLRLEEVEEGGPGVQGVADLEGLDRLVRDASLLQVFERFPFWCDRFFLK
jgi:hypothetical protein